MGKHAWGEKGEKEAEHEFSRNEKLTERMEHDAEHVRDHAEHNVERYSGQVGDEVSKLIKGIEHGAASQFEDSRRSVLEARAHALAASKAEHAQMHSESGQTEKAASIMEAVDATAAVNFTNASSKAVPAGNASAFASHVGDGKAAPVHGASISANSLAPAQVFLAQLAFVVTGASVVGLIPNIRRGRSHRRPT